MDIPHLTNDSINLLLFSIKAYSIAIKPKYINGNISKLYDIMSPRNSVGTQKIANKTEHINTYAISILFFIALSP